MAYNQKTCKGNKSDSSCTCGSNYECQDNMNFPKRERNVNNINDTVTAKNNSECSTECINCKLLNRLYVLLEEIVENRKITKITEEINKSRYDNDTKTSPKNNNEDCRKIKENLMRLQNNEMDDKKYKDVNVCKNISDTIKLICDCDKNNPETNLNCLCTSKKEHRTPQIPKRNENTPRSTAQYWHSVGEMKKQNQVDIACQCSYPKKDSSTQDCFTNKEEISKKNKEKCKCADSAVNTDTQNNSCVQNLYCSLLNDPMFRDAIRLMQSPNVVVLSNGCSCCNKYMNNTPLERTSVTTNTSEIMATIPEKNDVIVNQKEFNAIETNNGKRQQSVVTFTKNNLFSREPSIFNPEFNFEDPTSDLRAPRLTSNTRSTKDLPQQPENNNLIKNASFMVPQETEFTVASALVAKNGKKKGASKGKRRKSKGGDSNEPLNEPLAEKKDFINSCCQTDKNPNEEKCNYVLQTVKKIKDAAICCDLNKCNAIGPKLVGEEDLNNTAIQNQNANSCKNQNANSCNCTDIQNFVTIITELCAQLNKTKEKPNEIISCACGNKNNSTKTPVQATSNVHNSKDDCLEIQRLAEQIAEIHLKSNQNKSCSPNRVSRNDYRRSVDLARTTTSDCDLNNCIHVNSFPVHNMPDNLEECYCKCPCKKPIRHDKNDVCSAKKDKRGRHSVNPTPKRATKKFNELDCDNLNNWTQQSPSPSPQKCTCSNYECTEETEIDCVNYNISEFSKDDEMEKCPQLRRIIKECLCGSKNCYCHNAKLNEIKTTAKLERLADEVINTISPCNCKGQQCTCTGPNPNATEPGIRRHTTRQVCFSSIYHENQRKITNNTGKEKQVNKLFNKDANGNPCLNGSKSETDLYIKNLLNNKPTKNKACLKKVIPSSAKKLKTLMMKPLLPIPNTPCTQLNYINSLFPEIYQALSKIKELTNWETLPQEIVEIVIDKILKREIKSALQQMREGVLKTNTNDGSNNKNNANILNLLLEDQMESEENIKEFKNNVLDKRPEHTKQNPPIEKYTQHNCCEENIQETFNLTEDNNNKIPEIFETLSVNQKDFDANKKPILVQINIEKGRKSKNCNSSSINKIPAENSCVSLKTEMSSSSIYITENKLGAIKNLITLEKNNIHQNWEDSSDSSSNLSIKDTNQPISININIQMDKEKNSNLKNSVINNDEVKTKDSSSFSLYKENITETTQINTSKELEKSKIELERIKKIMQNLQEKDKSSYDEEESESINDLQQKKKTNADLTETTCLFYHENKKELPLLDDFLAMNKKMKVQKIKILPKNTNKTNKL